jgi:hypothetical protein
VARIHWLGSFRLGSVDVEVDAEMWQGVKIQQAVLWRLARAAAAKAGAALASTWQALGQ